MPFDDEVNLEGRLSITDKGGKEQFFAFYTDQVLCATDTLPGKQLSVVYVPRFFIPQQFGELIKRKIIQRDIKIIGQLKKYLAADGMTTYFIRPLSMYVTELNIDILSPNENFTDFDDPNDNYVLGDPVGDNKSLEYLRDLPIDGDGEMLSAFPTFPSPVPTPSKRSNISLFTPEQIHSGKLKLSDAEEKVRQALSAGGYEELSYYSFGNGFAIATPLEQTDSQANPLGDSRWVSRVEQSKVFDLDSFFKALFFADKGYFRVLVFIINDKPIKFREHTDKQTLMEVINEGSNRLPEKIETRNFDENMLCTALVYEFEHDENTQTIENKKPGRYTVEHHLTSTAINQKFEL
ncbi:hypothetical protein GCM10009114_33750 [Aliiglaciecola litoralis]|uniref:Uncharacterized protein n=1 Tax=Aliiglaciecola litoralis TaxID=582857 RepID=A0ABN1LSJ1_9ALTE